MCTSYYSLACEQALLFGPAKWASRERASEGPRKGELATLARNILFTRITSNQPVCFEGWNKFSVTIRSPWEPNLTHKPSGCQLSLLSINFDFRNVIFQPMVFPFVWAKYKWNFMRDGCKLSFPWPLAASPLDRAFSRDSLHSPQKESLLAG